MSEVTSVNSQTGAVVLTAADVEAVPTSAEGQPSGVATLDGSGVLHEAQLPSSVVSGSQEGGLGKLPAGLRSVVNITDPKYGGKAEPTFNNTPAIESAIVDAKRLRVPVYIPGTEGKGYGFEGILTVPDGVDLIGDGGDVLHPATELVCMSAGTTLAFGWTGVGEGPAFGNNPKATGSIGSRGGISGNILVNGNNVATQPVLFGSRAQSCYDPISVVKAAAQPAYKTGTTYKPGQRVLYKGFTFQNLAESTGVAPSVTEWIEGHGAGGYPTNTTNWRVVADSSGVVFQYGQNNHFRQLNIQECAGCGAIWDGGWGGGQIDVLEINECGSAGTWYAMTMQTYTGTPYAVPSKFVLHTPIFERGKPGALGVFLHVAGSQITLRDPIFEASGLGTAYSAVAMVYDGEHSSFALKLRDAQIQLDTENTNCFAVASGTRLDHSRTKITGNPPTYAYLLQEGARIEEERPEWSEGAITSLNPAGGVTTAAGLGIAAQARHYSPIELYTLGNNTAQAYVLQSGGMGCVNLLIPGTSNASGGASCIAFGGSSTAPTSTPTAGIVLFSRGNSLRYSTGAGTVGTVAGNWQIKEGSYKAVEGDVGIVITCKAKTAVILELPEAKVFGRGMFVIRRTDNASEATCEVKRQGSDELGKAGEALGTTTVAVAGYQVQRFLSDGISKWYGV